MPMTVSVNGRKQLELREGIRTEAYKDSRGILTIGVGHTSAAGGLQVTAGMKLTLAQVDTLLSIDLKTFSEPVNEHVKVKLTQNQYDALVSFAFNIGASGFIGSTVLRDLNKGDYQGAADAMLMWEKPPELKARREAERKQFLTPDPIITLPAPVAPVVTVPLPAEKPVASAPIVLPVVALPANAPAAAAAAVSAHGALWRVGHALLPHWFG